MNTATVDQQKIPATLKLEIIKGLHQGADISLNLGDYVLGSAPEADIVLQDENVAPEHAILRVDRFAVHVEAQGGDVSVGEKTVNVGFGCRVRMPATIAIGGAELALSRNNPGTSLIPEPLQPLHHAIVARPLLAISGAILFVLLFSVASRGVPASPKTDTSNVDLPNVVIASSVAPTLVNEAADQLDKQLKSNGLSLKVTPSDQYITISGKLAKRDVPAWTDTQRWFDKTYHGGVTLVPEVITVDAQDKPQFRMQALWYGTRPHIILEDGTRRYEGTTLNDGWRLQQIGKDRIVFQKESEWYVLRF
jgi:hypothetical protein